MEINSLFETTRKFWEEETVRGKLVYPDEQVIRFNRVGRCFHHPSHNTVRADPHTAFPKQKRYTSSIRRISPPLQGHTTLI